MKLSQVVIQYKAKKAGGKDLIQALTLVNTTLESIDSLDPKLADYVFFPLSHVFRDSAGLPSQALDIALCSLNILIRDGWRYDGGKGLLKQLLLLLGFLVGDNTTDAKTPVISEDTSANSMRCFTSFFQYHGAHISELCQSLETDMVPIMGHTVSVILSTLGDSPSTDIQLLAAKALESLVSSIFDEELLRSFLPGIVSRLTRTMQSGSGIRRSYKVLCMTLQVMTALLQKVLSDEKTLQPATEGPSETLIATHYSTGARRVWLSSTSSQLQIALSNIVPLRYHEREEVVTSLFELCTMILRECSNSLKECAELAFGTILSLCSRGFTESGFFTTRILLDLIENDRQLSNFLNALLYEWTSALSRVMQSTDSVKRKRHLAQLGAAFEVSQMLGLDTELVNDALILGLIQSVSSVMGLSPARPIEPVQGMISQMSDLLQTNSAPRSMENFGHLPLSNRSKDECLLELDKFIVSLQTCDFLGTLKRRLAEELTCVTNSEQTACLWICTRFIRDQSSTLLTVGHHLHSSTTLKNVDAEFLDAIYRCSLDLLSKPDADDNSDWRLQAIAMEIIALRSRVQRLAFRPELVDTLFPIVEWLGSPNFALRDHAIVCLDMVSRSCGYVHPSDLIIDNVDYLINAIALRFNTFDINPQTPQVLTMMVELCGQELTPYLDDLVESIFSALANYHGYSRLVEPLFSVLSSIVEKGIRFNVSSAENPGLNGHMLAGIELKSLSEVTEFLSSGTFSSEVEYASEPETFLDSNCSLRRGANEVNIDIQRHNRGKRVNRQPAASTDVAQAPSKTYKIVQSIVRLSQHYLTHESPSLRQQLLQLISRGCAALAIDEEEFLPLINDIWPVVMKRLYDHEVFVSISAMKTLSNIFRYAGSFVASRIDNEWHDFRSLYQRYQGNTTIMDGAKRGRLNFTMAGRWCEECVSMLTELIKYVPVGAEIEDDLVRMLVPAVAAQQEVLEGLDRLNADATWLEIFVHQHRNRRPLMFKKPTCQNYQFKDVTVPTTWVARKHHEDEALSV